MYTKNKEQFTLTERFGMQFLFLSTITILLVCFSDGISGNDFWWHIKVGEYIQKNHTVPQNDIFSWFGIEKNISWTAHEWLSDVVFYYIYNLFGELGIFTFSVIMAVSLVSLLYFESIKYLKNNLLVSSLFFSLFSIVLSLFAYGRPHIFSFFFLFFELKILFDFIENKNLKKLFFIPILAVLWSNFHGGSAVLSYALPLVFLVIGFLQFDFKHIYAKRLCKNELLALSFVSIGSVISVLINPIGVKVLLYPYTSFSDTLSMNVISEWQAPDAKIIGNLLLYFFPIAIMLLCMLLSEKKIRTIDIAVMGVFIFLFFRSARFIILWYIAAVFFGFRYMPICKLKEVQRKRDIIIVYSITLLFIIPFISFFADVSNLYKNDKLISTVVCDEAIRTVKDDSPQRIFNDYNVGEALIYNNIPVFFDARADLYSQKHILEDGVSLMFLEQNNTSEKGSLDVEKLLEKYRFDGILILKNRPLYAYLYSHPSKYICLYEDETVCYFKPVTS